MTVNDLIADLERFKALHNGECRVVVWSRSTLFEFRILDSIECGEERVCEVLTGKYDTADAVMRAGSLRPDERTAASEAEFVYVVGG